MPLGWHRTCPPTRSGRGVLERYVFKVVLRRKGVLERCVFKAVLRRKGVLERCVLNAFLR